MAPTGAAGGQAPAGHLRFPGATDGARPDVRARFEWILDGHFLVQRTHVPVPEAPDSMIVFYADPQTGGYTQHYYDSRGVARRYAMSLDAGVWRLVRDAPDFFPLEFCQRFVGTFSDDGPPSTACGRSPPTG